MTRKIIGPVLAGLLLASAAVAAHGQQFEADRTGQDADALGYLERPIDYRGLLSPPPARGDVWDVADRELSERLQRADAARWAVAEADSLHLYPRFDAAFGRPIRREAYPALIRLLNRTLRDVKTPAFEAKATFRRPRPFQARQLPRLCGAATPPKPAPDVKDGSSYPSGHSAYGWAVAFVLARVDPDRSAAVLERAAQYAESRVICGFHFPTDVQAGQVMAAAVVAQAAMTPAFQHDLAAARAEIAGAAVPGRAP